MDNCKHSNDVIDSREGTIICVDCGLVKDLYFTDDKKLYNQSKPNQYSLIDNMLDKFNISEYYSSNIASKLSKHSSKNLKQLSSEIYKTVNKDDTYLPLKTIMNVSGLKTRQIKSNDIHIVDVKKILEKYTNYLDLDFQTYTLIKEKIDSYTNTGFQPLSLIGGVIYIHCNENKIKLSMKKIANVLGISTISIQRFVKHVLSSRH